jgi:diacylglycerol kinase (ATP)
MKKILVIINLSAGTHNRIQLKELIYQYLGSSVEPDFVVLDSPGKDITSLVSKKLLENAYSMVVVAGGDGTVNKAARALLHTSIPLGILPTGSGNGLAHHLGIPMNLKKAIETINAGNTMLIDACKVNDELFFCSAGVGFDAHIGNQFSNSVKRGFFSYFKLVVREYWKYTPETFSITTNQCTRTVDAFLITAANANQWGNNIQIAPGADIADGLINLIILKPFPWYSILSISFLLMSKKIHHSRFVETIQSNNLTISRKESGYIHFDGEPKLTNNKLQFEVLPLSLKVIKG